MAGGFARSRERSSPRAAQRRAAGAGLDGESAHRARVVHKPRLLSDNGSSYLSGNRGMARRSRNGTWSWSAPSSPDPGQNRALAPGAQEPHSVGELLSARDLEAHIARFVEHYNHRRYHESLNNLTPAEVYFGRGQIILLERERIKRQTLRYAACSTTNKPPNIINQTSQASINCCRSLSQKL